MSLNLIGGASGLCHFLAISGLVLAWGRVGGGGAGPRVPGSTGRWSRAWVKGWGAQEAGGGGRPRGGGGGGQSGEAEKRQARCGYFNLINDRTPLRVCFNNQDTLQQVDRMFAVNLHMSSERAVSVNNVLECAGCVAASAGARQVAPLSSGRRFSLLVSGVSGQRRAGGGGGALWSRSFLSREFPGLPAKIRAGWAC